MERFNRKKKEALKMRYSPLSQDDQPSTIIDNTPVIDYSNRELIEKVQKYISFERKLRLSAGKAHDRDEKGNIVGIDKEKAPRPTDKNSRESMQAARKNAQKRKAMEVLFRRIHEELRRVSVR